MRLINQIKKQIITKVPLHLYFPVVNLATYLRQEKHHISPGAEQGIYIVEDDQERIHYCRRLRHNRYKNGVTNLVDELAAAYYLDTIPLQSGGLLIDCGANIGELGVWARARGLEYLPFEPETLEARCCDLNNFDGAARTIRKALWRENTTLKFYRKPDSADSSVIEMEESGDSIELEALALDDVLNLSDIVGPIVFKVEAEGGEPEVLEGASCSLEWIDYVAVDCGYERGKGRLHTFVETNNFLCDHGFRLEKAEFRRVTALYRNTRIGMAEERREAPPSGSKRLGE